MYKVLLLDDDDLVRTMLRATLVKAGYEVREVHDGEQALELCTEFQPDLLLTDIIMPGKAGLEIIGEVKQRYPTIKVVAMSGAGRIVETNYLKMAKAEGADAVLEKPFPNEQMLQVLKRLLEPANP